MKRNEILISQHLFQTKTKDSSALIEMVLPTRLTPFFSFFLFHKILYYYKLLLGISLLSAGLINFVSVKKEWSN